MQEIFNEVLTKEDEAALIVKEARDRALEIASSTEKIYQERLKEARTRSRENLSNGMDRIHSEQDARVLASLGDYEKKWDELLKKGEEKVALLAVQLAEITASTL